MKPDYAVLGANVTGTTLATLLAKSGHSVILADRRRRLTGNGPFDLFREDDLTMLGVEPEDVSESSVTRAVVEPSGSERPLPVRLHLCRVTDVLERAVAGQNLAAFLGLSEHHVQQLTLQADRTVDCRAWASEGLGLVVTVSLGSNQVIDPVLEIAQIAGSGVSVSTSNGRRLRMSALLGVTGPVPGPLTIGLTHTRVSAPFYLDRLAGSLPRSLAVAATSFSLLGPAVAQAITAKLCFNLTQSVRELRSKGPRTSYPLLEAFRVAESCAKGCGLAVEAVFDILEATSCA